jgi:hypothetical protein
MLQVSRLRRYRSSRLATAGYRWASGLRSKTEVSERTLTLEVRDGLRFASKACDASLDKANRKTAEVSVCLSKTSSSFAVR